MLSRILIDGYKSIDREELELRNFTILAGVNSAGKSSVIQALLCMTQVLQSEEDTEKKYLELGKFTDIRNSIKGNREIHFDLKYTENGIAESLGAFLNASDKLITSRNEKAQESIPKGYTERHKLVYLSVERIGIRKAYDMNVDRPREIGAKGEFAFSYLALFGQSPLSEKTFAIQPSEVGLSLNNQVDYWLEYIMGFHIRTAEVQDLDQVVVTYSNAKTNRYYRGQNVGTGITYIAMLIIAALSCKCEDTLIIENPEIHLHPRAQSRFMEFLAHLSGQGLQIILETHSDHIYNGMRKCIKNGRLSREKIAAYFLELDETMQTRISEIHFNDQGAEENHPYGMFDQFDDDLDELIGL